MSGRPRVIFFFMNGCEHCKRTWPAWNKAKPNLKRVADVEEKESMEVSPTDGVSSFPTVVVQKDGQEIKRIEGERTKASELVNEIGLSRSTPRRRRTYRRKRQFTKRTLRNYKSL
jgi:glutaredoxin